MENKDTVPGRSSALRREILCTASAIKPIERNPLLSAIKPFEKKKTNKEKNERTRKAISKLRMRSFPPHLRPSSPF
ncbi:Succinate dehydrogenase flavoprotein subunit [Sesbania bispinosa]|nr:Succinate dehydrogenase flavoprotein subunit [Sesbania bispinosa]